MPDSAAEPALVFLDAASGERLHPAARAALLATLDQGFADPSRLYGVARQARVLLDAARETVASVLDARPDEVSFAASGTAAAHLAVLGGLAARVRTGTRLVTSAVEHSCVLAAAETHEMAGGSVTRVEVDRRGRVDADAFGSAVRGPGVALASLQSANHEVGTRQPLEPVSQACLGAGVPLHVDAAQSVGRVPVRCDDLGAALLSASAHKWGGPAGVGVLVVRTGVRWRSPLPFDDRERGRVPGFENVPAIVAAAAALSARTQEMAAEGRRLAALAQQLREEVPRRIRDVVVIGDPDPAGRLPHIVTFAFLYVDGEALLGELDRVGIAANSGSSCAANTVAPSHVLAAMGVLTHGNLRISLGRGSTDRDVAALLDALPAAVERLRARSGVASL